MAIQTKTNMLELGALWSRKSAKGEKFLSGKLNLKSLGFDKDVEVIIFTNKNKGTNLKAPDLQVYQSTPRPGYSKPQATNQTPAKINAPIVQEEELI